MGLKETRELELKLAAAEGFVLPDLGGEPIADRLFTSTYHDSPDHRLARANVTLRRRVENGKSVWQLKLPRDTARLELEAPGGPIAPPPELARIVTGLLRGAALEPVATLRTRRAGVRVRDLRGGLAEVVLDSVVVLDAGRATAAFVEVEVELLDGQARLLRRLGKALRSAGATETDGQPKLFHVLDVQSDGGITPSNPSLDRLHRTIRAQVDAVLAHDPGVRLGREPEELHQLRVATRRLRAILRVAAPFVDPSWAADLREELAWLASELGPVRDLDVITAQLRESAGELGEADAAAFAPLLDRLAAEHDLARAALVEELGSRRYLALLDALVDAAHAPNIHEADETLAALAAAEFRKLRKAVHALGEDPSDDALHATRIRGKRARYAAELAEPLAGKHAAEFVRRAKEFQDVVGDHQDATVAEDLIRALAATAVKPAEALAAGRLIERQRARRAAAREEFPHAWERLDRAGVKGWS